MLSLPYGPFPQDGFISMGGFLFVNPRAWKNYLESVIQKYYSSKTISSEGSQKWMENNCILASLEKYLFSEYGVVIPADNLFKLYNQDGEGLPPEQILDAISSVISPLGFEVERVLVVDDELRDAVGHPDLVSDLSCAGEFHGRDGIGMINIRSGYSHAFFWKKMDQRKFSREEFRMAVLIKRSTNPLGFTRSVKGSLDAYCQLASQKALSSSNQRALENEIESLLSYLREEELGGKDFREEINRHLQCINNLLNLDECTGTEDEKNLLADAGALVRRIFREVEVLQ